MTIQRAFEIVKNKMPYESDVITEARFIDKSDKGDCSND